MPSHKVPNKIVCLWFSVIGIFLAGHRKLPNPLESVPFPPALAAYEKDPLFESDAERFRRETAEGKHPATKARDSKISISQDCNLVLPNHFFVINMYSE